MWDWVFRPQENDMRTLDGIRTPFEADAYAEESRQLRRQYLSRTDGAAIYQQLGCPARLLYQGGWPAMPGRLDHRARILEQLLAAQCAGAPAVLVYTDASSPAVMAVSRLAGGREVRGGGAAPQHAALLRDVPRQLWLDALLGEPGQPGSTEHELAAFLNGLQQWCAARGETLTPARAAALLRHPAPMLDAFGPPPADGSADPLAVPYAQREALARRLEALAWEPAAEPADRDGLSVYSAVRAGRSVSWLCNGTMQMTRQVLMEQLLLLARQGVPYTLVLDAPGAQLPAWLTLLDRLDGVRVLCRCPDTPGAPFAMGTGRADAFGSALARFQGLVLAGVTQDADLWSARLGSLEWAAVTRSRSRGLSFDLHHGLGVRADRNTGAAWQTRSRLPEDYLRRLLADDGRALLATDGRLLWQYTL